MIFPPELAQLTPDDQVTFRVGQVVRETVRLEHDLRGLHARLQLLDTPDPDSVEEGHPHFRLLVADTEIRLRNASGFPYLQEGLAVLALARAVYDERNRFVHDSLVPAGGPTWLRTRLVGKSGVKPGDFVEFSLDEIVEYTRTILRTTWMVDALDVTLAVWMTVQVPTSSESVADVVDWSGWLSILRGNFHVTAGGGAGL